MFDSKIKILLLVQIALFDRSVMIKYENRNE